MTDELVSRERYELLVAALEEERIEVHRLAGLLNRGEYIEVAPLRDKVEDRIDRLSLMLDNITDSDPAAARVSLRNEVGQLEWVLTLLTLSDEAKEE